MRGTGLAPSLPWRTLGSLSQDRRQIRTTRIDLSPSNEILVVSWAPVVSGSFTAAPENVPAAGEVRIQGVDKIYPGRTGSVTALRDVDVLVKGGEFLSILGPSGCGKSTLLRC